MSSNFAWTALMLAFSCPGGESVEEMKCRIDIVISKVCAIFFFVASRLTCSQVKEKHRLFFEEGIGARDVVIVAHGHFNRVLISRWIECDLAFGTKLNVEPAGVRSLIHRRTLI